MSLHNLLKRSEERSKNLAARGITRAGQLLEDAQRRIRSKMRIHPRTAAASQKPTSQKPTSQEKSPSNGSREAA